MIKVYSDEKVPIKSWVTDLEDGALKQAKNLANLPFVFHHTALMPDAHLGYGCPIGSVAALQNVIVPNLIGVDIGCGMCAVKTSLTLDEINPHLKTIMGKIRKAVPVGFNHHKEAQDGSLMPELSYDSMIIEQQYPSALKQLGTLGGGNHFIEIQKDEDNYIWIMIHSGSRNLGYKVAEHYNKIAKELNEKWYSSVSAKHELAFLPIDSDEGKEYIKEMNYCVKFALANRKLMMNKVMNIIVKTMEIGKWCDDDLINIAHNYAQIENHFGKNVIVHRKGATSAKLGEIGIIPGSQGTASYIVEGLGNPESFNSCSHGAGRRMGRNEARKKLDLKTEIKNLEDNGIIHSIRGSKELDEAPGAYKNIETVINNQKDLTKIVTRLRPIAVIKG